MYTICRELQYVIVTVRRNIAPATLIVSFLLLDITVSCEPMNGSEAIKQLSHRLAFNLRNLGLFGIETKPRVGLNFIV